MSKSRKRMSTTLRWGLLAGITLVLAGSALGLILALRAKPEDTGPNLFIIQRSKNTNEVHYDVQVEADGTLAKEPVVAYWVMKAKDGSQEDLTFFERKMAYGFEVLKPNDKGDRELKLVAWEDRKIFLKRVKDSAKWRAVTTIDGKEAYLARLFIQTDESGLTPSVKYVDLFGETVEDGDPVKEHIVKD